MYDAQSDVSVPPIYQLQNIECAYAVSDGLFKSKKSIKALRGISLDVKRGEIIGIVGESGCGKSTLARILLGLLAPSDGVILFDGIPLEAIPRRDLVVRVQPVFQDPFSALNPRKTVGEIVSLPLRIRGGISNADARKQAETLLDQVGLASYFINRYPAQLSGGQRQRVAIARALITRPQVVICAEPTSALDVSVQAQILNLLMDLQREFDLTYLFISHNLAVVEHIATRVAVMYLGRIVEEAPTAELFARPRHPYTRALLDSALTLDPTKGLPETALEGVQPSATELPDGCAFNPRCNRTSPKCLEAQPLPSRVGGVEFECHHPLNQ